MNFWYDAIKKHEHEFFPERFDNDKLVWAIGQDDTPDDTRAMIADHLLARDDFDVDKAIAQLEAEWWGDNPNECARAIKELEAARHRAPR